MLSVYLVCLVLGGGFALLSAFGDFLETDADFDADVDVDFDTDFDVSDTTGGAHADVGHASAIFSLRSLVYTLLGFGATGALLTWTGASPGSPLTIGFALVAGLLVGATVGSFLAYLKRSDTRAMAGDESYVGLPGRVTLPIREGSPGRIVVAKGGKEHAVRALPYPRGASGDPEDWRQVMVLEMRDGVALVDRFEGEGSDLLGPGA